MPRARTKNVTAEFRFSPETLQLLVVPTRVASPSSVQTIASFDDSKTAPAISGAPPDRVQVTDVRAASSGKALDGGRWGRDPAQAEARQAINRAERTAHDDLPIILNCECGNRPIRCSRKRRIQRAVGVEAGEIGPCTAADGGETAAHHDVAVRLYGD